MTLNGHFSFNFQFSLLRTAFQQLGYMLIVELFTEYFLYDVIRKDVRKRTVKLRSAEYCGSAKGLRIFRRRYIVETLTNKANIII